MNTSEQILVVILSTALAVLLVLAIALTVLVIKLVKTISRISEKAEHIVENVEHVGDTFRNAAGPLALFKVINNLVHVVSKHTKKR